MHPPTEPDAPAGTLDPAQVKTLLARVHWRLIPLLFFCYIIAYVDRINVGFAKLHLREVLGVDASVFERVFGFGSGLFFIGYFLFEVPSNLILQKVGARVWIARIMVFWGFVSMGMMFIHNTTTFYVMRFILGVAEAGFFPGIVLYFTYWYSSRERGRTIALFTLGGVIAGLLNSPLSGRILGLDGAAGLAGWQWLFLLEGIPAVLMGAVILVLLPDHPRDARWLSATERTWLETRLADEAAAVQGQRCHRFSDAFGSGRVWLLCLMYFLMSVGTYGYEMWMPSIIQSFTGLSDKLVGWINAVPYLVAGTAMVLVGRNSDRTGERRWHVAASAIASAVGFASSIYFKNPLLMLASIAVALAGIKSTLGPFWALTTTFLSGSAAAGGIALVNSVGGLGGFVGPYIVGMIKDHTKGNLAAMLFLGAALLGMGLLALTLPPAEARRE